MSPPASSSSPPPSRSTRLLGRERECWNCFVVVASSPSGQGSRGAHGELSLSLPPSFVSSQGDEGAALLAVEEVRGRPGSSHCARCVPLRRRPASTCACVCVGVALPCLLSPPPFIDSSFLLPLVWALSPNSSLLRFPLRRLFLCFSSSSASSQIKVGYSYYHNKT